MKNITTVILAAGKSSRFKNNTSKIFQDLGGLSIIEHVYQLAKKTGYQSLFNKDRITQFRHSQECFTRGLLWNFIKI